MKRSTITNEEAWSDAQAAGYTPNDPQHPGTANLWPGTCNTCWAEVAPRYNNVRKGHMACRFCYPGGATRRKTALKVSCPTCGRL